MIKDAGIESEVNGFKILQNWGDGFVFVKCKACKKPFKTSVYSLHRINGCGCNRPSQLKPLPEYINGFRMIKCLGYDTVKGKRRAIAECKKCKREYEVDPNYLKLRKHCGCMKNGAIACKYVKTHPQLAQTFKHMMGRCYNKNNQDYYNYGARGITVCDAWKKDRNVFCEWAIKNGFEEGKNLSIDRLDNSKGYSPKNCMWSDAKDQGRNTRRNVLNMELAARMRSEKGISQSKMAEKYGVSVGTVWLVRNNRIWKE